MVVMVMMVAVVVGTTSGAAGAALQQTVLSCVQLGRSRRGGAVLLVLFAVGAERGICSRRGGG